MTQPSGDGWRPSAREQERQAVRRRLSRRTAAVATAVSIAVVVALVLAIVTAPGWPRVKATFFDPFHARESFPSIVEAFWLNVKLFLIAEPLILALALAVALARGTRSPWLVPIRGLAVVYTDLFRGIPTILLLYLMVFGMPALGLQGVTNSIFFWSLVALVLSYGAYVAEVFRAGIESIHPSQIASAQALGLSRAQTMRSVVVPQAVRRVAPPLLNDFVSLQKDTALVSSVALFDATFAATDYANFNFNFTSLVVVACFFIAMTIPLARFTDWLQRRMREREQAGVRGGARKVPRAAAGLPALPPDAGAGAGAEPGPEAPRGVARPEAVAAGEPLLDVRDLRKSYGDRVVLADVDLSVAPHDVICLIGSSGSGKSTLLRCINLLEEIDDGVIEFEGAEISDPLVSDRQVRSRMGMVFQAYNLFPHLTVLDNCTLAPRRVHGVGKAAAEARALALLDRCGLADKARAHPDALSGGQQQRAALVRALCTEPRLLLLDEITAALDPELVGEVLTLVRELAAEGTTMVLATHEMAFARDVATKVCFLDGGRILEQGTPAEIFTAPQEERTRQFLARVLGS